MKQQNIKLRKLLSWADEYHEFLEQYAQTQAFAYTTVKKKIEELLAEDIEDKNSVGVSVENWNVGDLLRLEKETDHGKLHIIDGIKRNGDYFQVSFKNGTLGIDVLYGETTPHIRNYDAEKRVLLAKIENLQNHLKNENPNRDFLIHVENQNYELNKQVTELLEENSNINEEIDSIKKTHFWCFDISQAPEDKHIDILCEHQGKKIRFTEVIWHEDVQDWYHPDCEYHISDYDFDNPPVPVAWKNIDLETIRKEHDNERSAPQSQD